MTERDPGFYWIRVKSNGPLLAKEVAEWIVPYCSEGQWCRTGEQFSLFDEDAEVLSDRLEEP